MGQIRLPAEFHSPRSSGSAIPVPGGWVGGGGGVGNTNNHYHSSLSWVELSRTELRVDQQYKNEAYVEGGMVQKIQKLHTKK